MKRLILASQSPRRSQLLREAGFTFDIRVAGTDERRTAHESPAAYVQRVAREKCEAVWDLLSAAEQSTHVVLAADTEVVLQDLVFGKPTDAQDAVRMLRQLSGRSHAVLTAIAVRDADRRDGVVQQSQVRFAALDEAWIDDYLRTGEAFGKAGAYGIQGLAGTQIEQLQGSFTGVMGLPLHETVHLLERFGIRPAWRQT